MKFVAVYAPGDPDVLHVADGEAPRPGPGEVLIRVEAAGVSHADIMQRQGNYPPPPGASPILGLEAAGTIAGLGEGVTTWKVGDRVCALLTGGGYAEFVTTPAWQVLPIPDGWSAVEAATLPENAFTVFDNMVTRGRLQPGEIVLVHGGTSGIGSTAIMFARAFGAAAIATAGSAEKCAACIEIGALAAINYKTQDFVKEVARITEGRGVNLVVDIVGADYLARNLQTLALDGRISCIAAQSGTSAQLDLSVLLHRRATIFGSSLRPRTPQQKKAIADALFAQVWPLLPARDPIRPLVDRIYPFEQAAEAHRCLEASLHIGKIILRSS